MEAALASRVAQLHAPRGCGQIAQRFTVDRVDNAYFIFWDCLLLRNRWYAAYETDNSHHALAHQVAHFVDCVYSSQITKCNQRTALAWHALVASTWRKNRKNLGSRGPGSLCASQFKPIQFGIENVQAWIGRRAQNKCTNGNG